MLVVTACSNHLLGGLVVESSHYLAKKVQLSGGYHIPHSWYVVEHLSYLIIPDSVISDFVPGDT